MDRKETPIKLTHVPKMPHSQSIHNVQYPSVWVGQKEHQNFKENLLGMYNKRKLQKGQAGLCISAEKDNIQGRHES